MNKTRPLVFWMLAVLLVTLFAPTAVHSQDSLNLNSQPTASHAQLQQAMQNAWLAESVVAARESVTGRSFDPAYRASLKTALAKLPTTRLESLRYSGGEGSLGLDAIGDSRSNLVYTPVTPCRVFDTRYSPAGILAGETQRKFFVAGDGTTRFTNQGGSSRGCGIPYGPATAVIINLVAVAPSGAGNLRAWAASDNLRTVVPLSAAMNYGTAMYALANGLTIPICNPAVATCASGDLNLQADISNVHVVGDVVGYFRKLDLPAAMPMGSEKLASLSAVSDWQYAIGSVDVALPFDGACLVTCNLDAQSNVSTGYLGFRTARRNVTAGTNESDDGWMMDVNVPTSSGSASATYTWNMTGGQTYRFGCCMRADRGFVGIPVYPNVSWICR
ncbi:MAG: hypothetical protein ACYC7J_18720 [Syntrophales bacterium]